MNSNKYVITQNLLGQFMHSWHENNTSTMLEEIFTADAKLDIPERDINAKGRIDIAKVLTYVEEKRKQYGKFRDIHLTHSPAYCELMDGTCMLACDTYSFEPCKENGRITNKIEYFFTRINIKCKPEKGKYKIYKLYWRELQGMTPWDWDAAQHFSAYKEEIFDQPAPTDAIDSSDYLEVRNLATRFTQNNRKGIINDIIEADDTIIDIPVLLGKVTGYNNIKEALNRCSEQELQNDKMYLCIPTLGSPYIFMEGDNAVSYWICMTFGLKSSAFGRSKDNALITRTVGQTKVVCSKIDGEWKIKSYQYKPDYGFDDIAWTPSDRYNVMQFEEDTWRDVLKKGDSGTMADVAEIENMVAEWTYSQRYETPDFMDNHMDINNSDDLKVLITGSTREANIGYEAVRKRLTHPQANDVGVYDRLEKTPGYHTGSTPIVEIYDNGSKASGAWIDFAMVDVGGLMGLPKYPKRYMITVGRYFHHFVKEDGRWKQCFVGWDPLMNMPDMLYNPDISRGWICRQMKPFVFPPMFENFDEY